MNKYIFIQARMSSERLPGKVLLPFKDSTVIGHLYEKCINLKDIKKVVIITSDKKDDDAIVEYCRQNNMSVFRGSLLNVLDRFKKAALEYCSSNDVIIRLCGDSPLIDIQLLQDFINNITCEYSYFSTRFMKNGVFKSTTGKGNNIDALVVEKLLKINETNAMVREHIIYGFDFNNEFFQYKSSQSFNDNDCIDTVEDYERLLQC
jgi:spore coat polysaccharide biosynthesis protein SpsF